MDSIIGPDGRTYLPMPQTKVTRPKDELPIGRISSPWKVYGRTLGIVILSFDSESVESLAPVKRFD